MQDERVKVVTTARHNYAGLWYSIGDALTVSQVDAADLVAAGFAVLAPVDDPPKEKRFYKRRDMRAEK